MINKIIHGCLWIWNFSSRVRLGISLVSCAYSWALDLNTRREILYLRTSMYYSLFIFSQNKDCLRSFFSKFDDWKSYFRNTCNRSFVLKEEYWGKIEIQSWSNGVCCSRGFSFRWHFWHRGNRSVMKYEALFLPWVELAKEIYSSWWLIFSQATKAQICCRFPLYS